jgi:hypothetical protein
MNPYRNIPGADAPRRLPSLPRMRTLLAFALGLTAGVGLGPLAAVLALRSAPSPAPMVVAVPAEPVAAVEAVAPDPPDPPANAEEPTKRDRDRMTPEQAKATIARQADRVIKLLRARDTTALAAMIDEDRGLALNPFAQGSDFPRLEVEDVRGCLHDPRVRVWGDRAGEGGNVSLTCGAYWKEYLSYADAAAASDVTYNELRTGEVDMASNLGVELDDIFVRYFFPGGHGASKVLTLVFTPKGRTWKLGEIAHEERAADDGDSE